MLYSQSCDERPPTLPPPRPPLHFQPRQEAKGKKAACEETNHRQPGQKSLLSVSRCCLRVVAWFGRDCEGGLGYAIRLGLAAALQQRAAAISGEIGKGGVLLSGAFRLHPTTPFLSSFSGPLQVQTPAAAAAFGSVFRLGIERERPLATRHSPVESQFEEKP